MNQLTILIFQLIVLLFSAIVHEVSHGAMAYRLGDGTAKAMGRLTLNPKNHLDPFGSVLLPLTLFFLSGGSFLIGWAKPVPYNPENLKNPKMGAALIGIAGPLSNVALAVIFGVLTRLLGPILAVKAAPLLMLFGIIIFINLLLAVFNLVPIPPLDGSRVLFAFLPKSYYPLQKFLEEYGTLILLLFIFFGFGIILPIIYFFYGLLVGQWAIL